MNVLEAENLVRSYRMTALGKREDAIQVLKGLNLVVKQGEFIGIMGKSGCGKTTLLKVLGLIDKQTAGTVRFMGNDTSDIYGDQLAEIRRSQIGFIFQDFHLMDSLSVEENIMLPMILGREKLDVMTEKVRSYAEQFQICHLLKKRVYELSGGEKQRTAICRALINDPELILADEPTGNLDSRSSEIVIETLRKIHHDYGKTIIMVTHDPQMASYCSKILLMKDGLILNTLESCGNQEEFYQKIVSQMIYLQYNKKFDSDEQFYRLINTGGSRQKLFYNDVICISKIKGTKYVQYTTEERIYKEQISLEQLEHELDQERFLIVSRGIIVNLRHIVGVQGNTITMDNQMQIEMSRTKSAGVKKAIQRYWKREKEQLGT